MNQCNSCKKTFEEPALIGRIYPSYKLESITDPPDEVCPYCGSIDYDEATLCPSCGKYHTGCDDICDDCKEAAERIEAEAKRRARELVIEARAGLTAEQIAYLEDIA